MTYEFDGAQYEKASAHQTSWGERMVELLPLKGTERVLDLGCGDGRVSRTLALRLPRGDVLGVDASNGMIAAAKTYETGNLHFCVMEANRLPFRGQFDIIYSHAALHWVRDHGILLERIYDALRPGGYARLNFAGMGSTPTLIQALRETMSESPYIGYFTGFVWPWYMPDLPEYERVLSESPFPDFAVREEYKERLFPSAESLIGWIDQPCLVPYLAVIAEHDKPGFRDAVIARMIQRTKQRTGGFLELFYRLDVIASKKEPS